MSKTDTSEAGLESLIENSLLAQSGYQKGSAADYDRDHAVDFQKLSAFLQATQPKAWADLVIGHPGTGRTQFLGRLQGEITKRGIVDVRLRRDRHGPERARQADPGQHQALRPSLGRRRRGDAGLRPAP
jgi:type I restriction enzyme R subunit